MRPWSLLTLESRIIEGVGIIRGGGGGLYIVIINNRGGLDGVEKIVWAVS